MTQLLLGLLYVQSLLIAFFLGYWISSRRQKKSESVASFSPMQKDVDNFGKTPPPKLQDVKPLPDKHTPKSTISKFPSPELVRKQKDQDQVTAYLEDMKKNKRPGGAFVLSETE